MIPRVLALTLTSALAVAALTGCVRLGPMASTSREIGEVTAVVLDTSGDLEISEGEPSLTIHAPAGMIDMLTSDVSDGVLELGRRPGAVFPGWGEIRYELTVETLDSIELKGSGDITTAVSGDSLTIGLRGSGDVTVEGLDTSAVEVIIDGSGDVELSGDSTSLAIELDGSGEIDAEDLEVIDATVDIGGSGEVRVNSTGTLSVQISGSGSVRYTGGADVDSHVSGSGEVEADD